MLAYVCRACDLVIVAEEQPSICPECDMPTIGLCQDYIKALQASIADQKIIIEGFLDDDGLMAMRGAKELVRKRI